MNSLDSQIEELIKERNAFEAENIALKAQVNQLREALTSSFNGAWDDEHATLIDTQVRLALSQSSEQCLNSVKADAISKMTGDMPAIGFNSERDKNNWIGDYIEDLRSNNG